MNVFDLKFTGTTLIASIGASIAAVATAGIGWPVWAMFIGWVAFFTGPQTPIGALRSYLCVAMGIAIGNIAALGLSQILPSLGFYAFAPVVFIVAVLVLTLRAIPFANIIPAYFLGLIAFFAAHITPGLYSFIETALVCTLGGITALIVHTCQSQLNKAK
ncbi:MAG: DUF1097 domain-containing protein [Methyloligellaceae bacterium]